MQKIIFNLIILITTSLPHATPQESQYTFFKNEIVQNFDDTPIQNIDEASFNKKVIEFPSHIMNDTTKHIALFSLLSHGNYSYQKGVADNKTISDLNVFFYDALHPHETLLEQIYCGYSLNGKIAQGMEISHPTGTITLLEQRQKAISYLQNNRILYEKLILYFKELASLEDDLYSLWNKNDFLYTKYIENTFYKGSFKKFTGKWGTLFLEYNKRKNDYQPLVDFLTKECEQMIADVLYAKIFQTGTAEWRLPTTRNIEWIKALINKTAQNESRQAQIIQNFNLFFSAVSIAMIIGDSGNWIRSMKNYKRFVAHIKKRFSVFISLNEIIKKINHALESDAIFKTFIPSYEPLREFTTESNEKITTFISNITKIHHHQSFTYFGSTLSLLPHFLEIKNEFGSLFQSLGMIESLVSTANLMEKNNTTLIPWTFAQYEAKTHPHIKILDYIHPLLSKEKAVPNSIELGEGHAQGMIITGPNASGKSLNIRSIATTLLLSQSLGVAPAHTINITPMSKILTYLNPEDSISNNQSLFQVEEDRILSIVNQIYYLPPTDFSFIAADELLSSTAPTEGEAATFGIYYGLSMLPGCIPILATHFSKLTALPQHTNNFYANYHVSVLKNMDGSITHTFKLEPGTSSQIIAIDLARVAGFDQDILNCAEEFLTRNKKP